MMPTPGAVAAIAGPKFEKPAINSSGKADECGCLRTSALQEDRAGKLPTKPSAETAMTPGYAAGWVTGFRRLFPAATTTSIPCPRASRIASSVLVSGGPPPKTEIDNV